MLDCRGVPGTLYLTRSSGDALPNSFSTYSTRTPKAPIRYHHSYPATWLNHNPPQTPRRVPAGRSALLLPWYSLFQLPLPTRTQKFTTAPLTNPPPRTATTLHTARSHLRHPNFTYPNITFGTFFQTFFSHLALAPARIITPQPTPL